MTASKQRQDGTVCSSILSLRPTQLYTSTNCKFSAHQTNVTSILLKTLSAENTEAINVSVRPQAAVSALLSVLYVVPISMPDIVPMNLAALHAQVHLQLTRYRLKSDRESESPPTSGRERALVN
jgi:hypothetical protein